MARIERATSPLPRECSTTEPHGRSTLDCKHRHASHWRPREHCTSLAVYGAGDGNRTRVISLEGWGSTIELLPPWESRDQPGPPLGPPRRTTFGGGGGWIRTSVGVSQQIYSLPPLATRAPLHAEPAIITQRPASAGLERPPVDEMRGLREVAALRHEAALHVVGRVTGQQHARGSPGRHGFFEEAARLVAPEQEDRRIRAPAQILDDLRCERLPTTARGDCRCGRPRWSGSG